MNKYNKNLIWAMIGTFIVMVGTKLMNEYDNSYILLILLFMIMLMQLDIIKHLKIKNYIK